MQKDTELAPLTFRVLGPLVVMRGSRRVEISSGKQRALLGLLLVRAGEPVARQTIIDALWGPDAPASRINLVHTYVSRVRRAVDAGRGVRGRESWLVTRGSGYAIRTEFCDLDLLRFRALVAGAEREEQLPQRLRLMLDALEHWRDPCLGDLDEHLAEHPWIRDLNQEWTDAVLATARIAGELRRTGEIVPHLRAVSALNPLNEAVHAWLVTGLADSGAQAAALAEYAQIRGRLVEELGIEPGPHLQAAQRHALGRADPQPATPSQGVALILGDQSDFVGRETLLDSLRAEMGRCSALVLTGAGGAGKSALAVQLAHRLAPQYPDGQVHIEAQHGDAVVPRLQRRVLHALGHTCDQLPGDAAELAVVYRSALADRRLLLVFDNLADETQLAPLLPGNQTCAVVATSRGRRRNFPNHQVREVDSFTLAEGITFLAQILGSERVAQEPAAAEAIVRLCSGLPLALRIVAVRLADRPQCSLSRMVQRLSRPGGRMAELSLPGLCVRATFEDELDQLDEPARKAFHAIGGRRDERFSQQTAIDWLGHSDDIVEELLGQLTDRRLIRFDGLDEGGGSWYSLSGLNRILAQELAP
ncbi:BTAD domain-containing putative transcriptional regulator [Kineosporia babensis]|uniref:NB-ARC domain-containing protein n=1 Tax=Kineosporia babensis TaxID=499548 RepID=A0A9X1NL40_9ACTN|nr:BTAD domain-containing putative transcriptional regulator [Kineosporia babensis]MCD5316952.1 NB-ARC domain-containing protein [Kineosporia babensis]